MSAAESLSPQALAEACARAMWDEDNATRHLGMELVSVAPGKATIAMTVAATMTNGHGTCHGGYIFTLADSAFAFACNTYDVATVAASCDIVFVAPTRSGDVLEATAAERHRAGRRGVYDVTVTRGSPPEVVAEFRGISQATREPVLRQP